MSTPTPTPGRILVKFDMNIDTPLGLAIPERYVVHEQGSEGDNETRMAVTTDRRLINPQVVEVLSGEYAGERAFVYYGAYEVGKWVENDNYVIPETMLLFLTDPIRMMPNTYLGEEIAKELPKTDTGIYTTPVMEEKEPVCILLTHVPENATLSSGTTVITIDRNQYYLRYEGKQIVKLTENEIAGYIQDGDAYPYGGNLLVAYLTNPEDAEIIKYNEEIKAHADFCRKHNWHIEGMSFEQKPLGKFTRAKLLRGENEGKEVLVYRNIGVNVGENLSIIGQDALIGIFLDEGAKKTA